jgi:hypothetical protein
MEIVVITGISWCLGTSRNDDRYKDGRDLVTEIPAFYFGLALGLFGSD